MTNPDELERAVERLEKLAAEWTKAVYADDYPDTDKRETSDDLRLILSANREMRAALQKLSYQMNFLSRMADGQKRCERGKGPATWKTTIDAIRSEALVGEDYARSALTTQRGDG